MYIGIDLGTSGVKAILLSEQGDVLATQTEKLQVSRPHPLWSEQDPEQWWQATDRAIKALGEQHSLRDVKALGIAGQMHGATLLDSEHRVLRPAILWNDGRCAEECALLEERVPTSREITGNLMMPGFTAPKLLWVQRHEPEIFRQVAKVLLPKDYLRFRMTGDFASDMSDAAGTMWLDVAKRDWSEAMLDACHLTREHMPALFEGSEVTGTLLPAVAERWNMPAVPVVAGAVIMRRAVGVGMVEAGRRCCRWERLASILPSATAIAAILKARCTVSVMPFREMAFDVGDAECGILPGLGGKTDRHGRCSGADCRSTAGG
jgi:xylulokinase